MPATDQRLRPLYPVDQMTTWELTEYRARLEATLALEVLPKFYLSRDELQKQLDAVLVEQAERERIRRARP